MKYSLFLLLTIIGISMGYTQTEISWKVLSKVTFADKYFPGYDDPFMYPTFLPEVKVLESKTVSITGYFLNVDPQEKVFMLSKSPMASCFFCGAGGPETVIEMEFLSRPDFPTDAIVKVTGKLSLNADDVEHFNYILTGCKGQLIE
ncbi:hypothetical protein [Robertkochia solimangrovi]|uniref:hypothetical protein n=1 Tax=Robertkochia solimangrovi TaxID=2213046 RepID=UPI00118024F8|nr:hypothetical protein [Robertkochia solimangrovi]TRZ42860.1 hypothetical protein DMZ48_12385 [Robertkochia solimangrovi]